MWRWLLGPLRMLWGLLRAGGSPHGLALGFAFGMTLGLLPKGNLTAVALSLVVLALEVNLTAVAAATMLFSWVAVVTDPLAHRIGWAILTAPSCQTAFAKLYELPLVPWTALNNTVVLGSLVLSLVLFYPVYRLSWLGFTGYRAWIAQMRQRYRIGQPSPV